MLNYLFFTYILYQIFIKNHKKNKLKLIKTNLSHLHKILHKKKKNIDFILFICYNSICVHRKHIKLFIFLFGVIAKW